LAALVREIRVSLEPPLMQTTLYRPPRCSLYLFTPPLFGGNAEAFAKAFAEVLAAIPVASALVRLESGVAGEAKAIVAPLLRACVAADCALLIENDARLAVRLGADGVHVGGAGAELDRALESLKPERIVGAGALRTRDEAMTAGEAGADYVMFGEPHGGAPAMALRPLIERVGWWAEIFETPCVAFADSIEAAGELARAGADFVALDDAIWSAAAPAEAAREAHGLLAHFAANTP
jgi:thiamine-phosphate pyrophosphorylase